jgi:dihydroxyacetone kinase phosphoprotein-dependent L subunit
MISTEKMKQALLATAQDLIQREVELCKLDSFVGDGDHGATVRKAFTNIRNSIEKQTFKDIESLFRTSSMALAEDMGGAIGPIFASILFGLSAGAKEKQEVGSADLAVMFATALEKVQNVGGAQVGDKTLVDALAPAAKTLNDSQHLSEEKALKAAAESALEGARSTARIMARKGRSQYLGEHSKGYVDAGSMTMYYFINGLADSLQN